MVQEICVGELTGVPISTNRFSPAVKALFVPRVILLGVVEAVNIFILFGEVVASWKEISSVPTLVKHLTLFQVSAILAVPTGIVVVPVQEVEVA